MKLGVTSALAVISLSTLAASGSLARQAPAPAAPAPDPAAKAQAWQKSCEGDIQKLCKDLAAKGADVRECLAAHEKDLSEACSSAFLARYKVMQLCKEDIDRLCKDTLAAGGPLGKCFKEHEKDLSAKCRTALVKGSKRQQEEKAKAAAPAGSESGATAPPASPARAKKPARK
jgi:hypothetical protein